MRNRKRCNAMRGLTLVETLVAIVLVGLTIAAIIASTTAFTRASGVGIDLSTAEFLIEEIREMTASLPVIDPENGTGTFGPESGEAALANYDDIDDFDGATFSPPVDIHRNALNDFAGFTQRITVENVDVADLTQVRADHSTDFVRMTVEIVRSGQVISSCSWIRTGS